MPEVLTWGTPVERQFHGALTLVILHMRRIAHSNELEDGFAMAAELKMFEPENERFVRQCLVLDERFKAKESIAGEVSEETVKELRRCAIRLNSADPA